MTALLFLASVVVSQNGDALASRSFVDKKIKESSDSFYNGAGRLATVAYVNRLLEIEDRGSYADNLVVATREYVEKAMDAAKVKMYVRIYFCDIASLETLEVPATKSAIQTLDGVEYIRVEDVFKKLKKEGDAYKNFTESKNVVYSTEIVGYVKAARDAKSLNSETVFKYIDGDCACSDDFYHELHENFSCVRKSFCLGLREEDKRIDGNVHVPDVEFTYNHIHYNINRHSFIDNNGKGAQMGSSLICGDCSYDYGAGMFFTISFCCDFEEDTLFVDDFIRSFAYMLWKIKFGERVVDTCNKDSGDKCKGKSIMAREGNGHLVPISSKLLVYLFQVDGIFTDGLTYCWQSNFKKVDWSLFDVKNTSHMFTACNREEALDLTGMDTSQVTDMQWMFHNSDYTLLNLSSFNTSNVKNMDYMFTFCKKLETIDASNFKLRGDVSCSRLRDGGKEYNLKRIYASQETFNFFLSHSPKDEKWEKVGDNLFVRQPT